MSGSYTGIGEMELEENVQVWQKKIHESCYMVNGEGLVSSHKYLKRCAVVERMCSSSFSVHNRACGAPNFQGPRQKQALNYARGYSGMSRPLERARACSCAILAVCLLGNFAVGRATVPAAAIEPL